jgi:long-chain acyl-CoA synthetase
MAESIPFIFQSIVEKYKDRIVFNYFNSSWKTMTYGEFFSLANNMASFLFSYGIHKGDRVAIVSENRPEWCAAYMAILICGGAAVPIDMQLESDEIKNLLMDSETKIIFYSAKTKENVLKAIGGSRIKSINFDAYNIQSLPPLPITHYPSPDDIASIIYTSGTTGKPKGVMLTHENFCSDAEAVIKANVVTHDDNVLSILPFHHTYPFMCTFLVPVFLGAAITFTPGLKAVEIISTIKEKEVTIVVAVPRLLELIRDGIFSKIKQRTIIANVLLKSIKVCGFIRRKSDINIGKIIFKTIHRNFGILRFFTSGGARLDPAVMNDLEAVGFTILEGYGLTETAPVITFNPVKKRKPGSVGKPLPNVEIKIRDDGEITVKCPMLMKGYFKNEIATKEAVIDGWFLTGDIGYMDAEGFIFITGRKKEVIVLSSGKNVYPEDMEKVYASIPLIKEICVTEKDGSLHAVIVPNFDYAKKELIGNISEALLWKINAISMKLPEYMRIKGFTLYSEPLPHTPLGKLRRFMVKDLLITKAEELKVEKEDEGLREDEFGRKVVECIRFLMKEKTPIKLSDNLELNLGFDSLMRIELISALETAFSASLPETFVAEIQTVQDIIAKMREYAGEKQAFQSRHVSWMEILNKELSVEDKRKVVFSFTNVEILIAYILFLLQKALFKILFRLKVSASKGIPVDGPYIIASNHVSFLDGFVIASSMPFKTFKNIYFLGFQKYFVGKLRSHIARLSHVIPIDPDIYLNKALQVSAYVIKNKRSLCIFPEGGRSFDGSIMPFKKGIGVLALELNIPVIPAFIKGTFEALPRGAKFIRPSKIEVFFGMPIYLSDIDMKKKPDGIDEYQFFADELRKRVVALSENG